MQALDGLLVIDKPAGITSREAVNRAMRWFPPRTRIGHTGTLDPLATGVLVLCLGRATRLAEFVQDMDKSYRAAFVLGARSDTDDADGAIEPFPEARPVERAAVEAALNTFFGPIEQTPPRYSAVKVGGRRAHDLARRGQAPTLKPRTVHIYRIGIEHFAWPNLALDISCGKGTYVRSLARDLGERLGVGAYVAELRRTRIGPFAVTDGLPLTAPAEEALARIRPPADAVAHLPRIVLDDSAITAFRHGQGTLGSIDLPAGCDGPYAAFSADGELIGTGKRRPDGALWPEKVLDAATSPKSLRK